MPQISYLTVPDHRFRKLLRRSVNRLNLRSQQGCPVSGSLQTWQLPRSVLPESHHHRTKHIPGNLFHPFFRQVPFLLPQKDPVLKNRLTYPRPEYVSCQDVPVSRNPHDEVLSDLLPENIRGVPVLHRVPVLHVLLTVRNGLCPPFSDFSDQCSSLQNRDR